jgi:predicted DsbA family dithiol-disulfide isomerase
MKPVGAVDVQITVVTDTMCPWCFIGLRRLQRALLAAPAVRAQLTFVPYVLCVPAAASGQDGRALTLCAQRRRFAGARSVVAGICEAALPLACR